MQYVDRFLSLLHKCLQALSKFISVFCLALPNDQGLPSSRFEFIDVSFVALNICF